MHHVSLSHIKLKSGADCSGPEVKSSSHVICGFSLSFSGHYPGGFEVLIRLCWLTPAVHNLCYYWTITREWKRERECVFELSSQYKLFKRTQYMDWVSPLGEAHCAASPCSNSTKTVRLINPFTLISLRVNLLWLITESYMIMDCGTNLLHTKTWNWTVKLLIHWYYYTNHQSLGSSLAAGNDEQHSTN